MEKNKKSGFVDFRVPTESFWLAASKKTDYPYLQEDIKTEVAVVGGGMTGLTTAYLLKKEGFKVAVIEAGRIAQGTSGHTTAKITSQHSIIYSKIKNYMGKEKAKQYADANQAAISTIFSIVNNEDIDCDFHWEPSYTFTFADSYLQKVADEAGTASSLGLKASFTENIPLPFKIKGAVKFDDQARFHPRKYLTALSEKIEGDGCFIFENTRVIDVNEGNPGAVVTDKGKKVTADNIVIASHFPCYDGMGFYFARMYPERSYLLALKVKEKFPGGMYVSAEDPGRSLRSHEYEGSEILLVAGEHHKTARETNLNKHYENLMDFARSHYDVQQLLYRWSAQDYTTLDKVPYAGRLTSKTPNIYVATGFRKWGMTNSTVSSMIIKDLIIKGENPWEELYSPSRFVPNPSIISFMSTNAGVAANLVTGKLKPVPQNIELEEGEAGEAKIEGCKMGIYKDNNGGIHTVDTTCTHMGCELKWNDAEKSWDCPCHGSRFTYDGNILEGPAVNKLEHDCHNKNKIEPNVLN